MRLAVVLVSLTLSVVVAGVPVQVGAQVGAQSGVPTTAQAGTPTAARALARGTVIAPGDVENDSSGVNGASSVEGWVTRRLVRKGESLREPAVSPPQIVHAGSTVTLRAAAEGVVASRTGTALSGGALGERVRVRLDAQHIITAIVAGPATIRLP